MDNSAGWSAHPSAADIAERCLEVSAENIYLAAYCVCSSRTRALFQPGSFDYTPPQSNIGCQDRRNVSGFELIVGSIPASISICL
jgi:hypothetical protein